MKSKLLYYTDCRFFAGCENMLANFLNSKKINNKFDVYFSYRKSKDYELGLKKRVSYIQNRIPMNFVDLSNPDLLGTSLPFIIRRIIMIFIRLLVNIPLFIYEVYLLCKMIKKIRPQIVHINSGGFPPTLSTKAMIVASRIMSINKTILVINNSPESYLKIRRIMNLPMDVIINFCVDIIVTGSQYNGKKMKKLISIENKKVISIPNGIEKRKIILSKTQVKKQLGLSSFKGKIFLIVALLIPRKGHKVLIDAITLLKKDNILQEKYLFIIEGEGPLEDSLKKLIKKRGLNKYFKFIRNYKNIFDLINLTDILLLTSISSEDFPNVVLEAMSLQKIIISSKIAGVPEQIKENKSGFLFNVGNSEELAAKIQQIFNKKLNLDNIGKNALKRYRQYFSAEKSVNAYIQLYQKRNA